MDKMDIKNVQVGEIVTNDFRTAEVFKKAGIDFCCGGKQTVSEACKKQNIDLSLLEEEISAVLSNKTAPSQNFKDWDLPFLIDFIVNTHHKYVVKTLPELKFYTQKIASVHGENHPELIDIAAKVDAACKELDQHLSNEEEVLFPAIKNYISGANGKDALTIVSEIKRMTGEHEFAGGTFDEINQITNGYQTPADACNTYQVAFKTMQQFEDDLHVHVHLENNILYPKALELTKNNN